MTKLDILDSLSEVKVGAHYQLDGRRLDYFPANSAELARVEVEYITLPGWSQSTEGVRAFADLPENAQEYIRTMELLIGVPGAWWTGGGTAGRAGRHGHGIGGIAGKVEDGHMSVSGVCLGGVGLTSPQLQCNKIIGTQGDQGW